MAALAEPALFRTFRILDPDALSPDGEVLRQSTVFRLAWHRFIVFRLEPWSDRPEPGQQEGSEHGHSHGHGHSHSGKECCSGHGPSQPKDWQDEKFMKAPPLMAMI